MPHKAALVELLEQRQNAHHVESEKRTLALFANSAKALTPRGADFETTRALADSSSAGAKSTKQRHHSAAAASKQARRAHKSESFEADEHAASSRNATPPPLPSLAISADNNSNDAAAADGDLDGDDDENQDDDAQLSLSRLRRGDSLPGAHPAVAAAQGGGGRFVGTIDMQRIRAAAVCARRRAPRFACLNRCFIS